MTRYIDADALISDLEYDVELDSRLLDDTGLVGLHREFTQFDKDCKANTIAYLKEAPTVDAVPVIRCKECKNHHEAHYEEDGEDPIIKHKCKLLKGYQFSENHYCGFAERKEE